MNYFIFLTLIKHFIKQESLENVYKKCFSYKNDGIQKFLLIFVSLNFSLDLLSLWGERKTTIILFLVGNELQ
jgi:hypothetical protein